MTKSRKVPGGGGNGNGGGTAVAAPGAWDQDADREAKDLAHLAAMESTTPVVGKPFTLPKLDIGTIRVRLVSDSQLVVHNWSRKAIKEMLDKQMGTATAGKEKKDPNRDYEESLYRHPDGGYGFPAIAFKCAAVEACTSLGKSITKVAARQAFHVIGKLVKIEGTPQMREDMVRVGQSKTADIRYRAEFLQWSTWVNIRYNARVLSDEQIINMLNTAGFAVGVGEYRPERDGDCGMFHVAMEGDL